MRTARVSLLIFLLVILSGCSVMGELQSKVLLRQANKLMERDTDVTQQWSVEFLEVFTPTNRAQFPLIAISSVLTPGKSQSFLTKARA